MSAEASGIEHRTGFLLRLLVISAAIIAATAPAALAAGSSSPSAPATAGAKPPAAKQASFGIGPASVKKLDGRPFLNYLSSPGGKLSDHVAVINLDTRPVTLKLYVAAAQNESDGSIGYAPAKAVPTDAAAWISIAPPGGGNSLRIAARSTVIVPITLAVPNNATPGDHAAGVIASLTSKVKGKSGQLVDFEQRIAVRTYLRVSGPLRPALTIEQLHAGYHGNLNPIGRGRLTVSYRLHNTGNVKLGGRQLVKVTGLLGATGSSKVADVGLLLPGSSVLVRVAVNRITPTLWMHGKVTIKSLQSEGDVNPPIADVSTSTTFWAVPWTLIGTVGLLAVVLILLWRRRRRPSASPPSGGHRRTRPTPPDSPVTPETEVEKVNS
ncbi:MAG: hypothetical protein ABI140_16265 [Jatrophihabitantaceae bacterium]